MRAVVIADHAMDPGLADLNDPTAGPGAIRVKVRSSSLNGFDTALVKGARIPDGVDYGTAGALGLAGAAAVTVVEQVSPAEGETVLVAGATGGVGAVAMQLLADRGATVLATAMPGEKEAHVRALGATHVVDRTSDLAAQVRAIAPDGVDVVLHLAGDPFDLADLLVDGGRIASLLGVGSEAFEQRKIVAYSVVAAPLPPVLERLAGDVAAGRLRIPIQRSYGLDQVPQALADFAAGTLGKLVITVD